MNGLDMKELRLHTLRGDIYTCIKVGMTKVGTKRLLKNRYVNQESGITSDEFDRTLDEWSKKAEAKMQK